MSRDWNSRGFAPAPIPKPVPLPDYVAPARAFFGDDDQVGAYLALVEGYADDGDAATALINAAQAAGDVDTAITILEGGGGTIPEYDTIAEVVAAIGAAELAEGDICLIRWAGDLYEPDGEAIITVRNGRPSWEVPIPWPQVGTTISTITASNGATVTQDADGRPICTVPAVNGAIAEVLFGLQIETPSLYVVKTRLTQAAPSSSGDGTGGPCLRRSGAPTNFIQLFLQFFSGSWNAGGYYNVSPGGVAGPAAVGPNPTTAGQFSAGVGMTYLQRWFSEGLVQSPLNYFVATPSNGGPSTTSMTALAGAGSWLAASTDLWEPYHRLRSTGVAASEIVTALALATPA